MSLKRVILTGGMVLGAVLTGAPFVMGQETIAQVVKERQIDGVTYTATELTLKVKKDTSVYSKADIESKALFDLDKGQEVPIVGYSDQFALVDFKGKDGFVYLGDLDLKGTGITFKEVKKKAKKEPIFSEKTIVAFEALGVDMSDVNLEDGSVYTEDSLLAFKEAAIAYGKALKTGADQAEVDKLKTAFEEAKAGLVLKEDALEKPKKKVSKEKTTVESTTTVATTKEPKKETTTTQTEAPKTTEAPQVTTPTNQEKFAFPSVPQGLEIIDGKTIASVMIDATTNGNVEAKSSPNHSQGTVVATIQNGTTVRVTGISTDGMARIDYNGQIVYVSTQGLK